MNAKAEGERMIPAGLPWDSPQFEQYSANAVCRCFTQIQAVYGHLTCTLQSSPVRIQEGDMRHAHSKFDHDSTSRYDGFGFALVIVSAISAVSTAIYGLAMTFQGGFPSMP
jgi:hypothetical protein